MEISVIMLTYNRELFISRAIESVLSQSFKDYELILVDNGSTDKSAEICDFYAKNHKHVKVIHRERGNIGSGRNAGLDIASGRYITFVDDDDVAYPDMLDFLYSLATNYEADISLCGSERKTDGIYSNYFVFDKLMVMNTIESLKELLARKYFNVVFPTKLIHRSIFDKIRFLNYGKYDDIVTTYKVFAEASKVVANGKSKYCFTRHNNNNSSFVTNDLLITSTQLDEYFTAFSDRTSYLSDMFPELTEYVQYTEWSFMISMCNKIHKNKLTNCEKHFDHIKNVLKENHAAFYHSPYTQQFERDLMDEYIKL